MRTPLNPPAHLIVSAESTIADLLAQRDEIDAAIDRQENTIVSLTPVAEWSVEEPEPAPEVEPEPTHAP